MRNILLLVALCALFCLVQSLNLQTQTIAASDNSTLFYHVTNSSGSCESIDGADCLGEGDDSCETLMKCTLADGNCCAQGLICYGNVSTNATCVSNNIGDWCTSSLQCFQSYSSVPGTLPADYSTSCVSEECTVVYFPGDYCEANTDCNTNNCDTDNNVCLGLGFNETCSEGQCAYGLTCSYYGNTLKKRCSKLTPEGANCTSDSECYLGYACIAGSCAEAFSAEQGDSCSGPYDCDSDYVCYKGKCVEGNEFDTSSCDSDSDCDSSSICMCSRITGEQFCYPLISTNYTNGRDSLSSVFECVRDNNCTNFGLAPNSCIMQNCESDADDTFDTDCDLADSALGDCYYNDSCGGFPVWAIIVIVIVAVVLVLVIVVVVVMAMRKRRQYDTIA